VPANVRKLLWYSKKAQDRPKRPRPIANSAGYILTEGRSRAAVLLGGCQGAAV